jgi:predicted RecA/RadA family phage recombinase
MAKNLVQDGHRLNVVAGGTVTAGEVATIGDLIGVALNSGESGDTIVYALSGVWDIPRAAAEAYDLGEEVGVTSNEVVKAGTGSYAMEAVATPAAGTLAVMINGNPGPGG